MTTPMLWVTCGSMSERRRRRAAPGWATLISLRRRVNALTRENLRLRQAQGHTLRMNALTFEIARAVRATTDIQQALDVLCAGLGEGLGIDRVVACTFDAQDTMLVDAQWHLPDLLPLGKTSPELLPHLARLAEQVWLTEGVLARIDLLDPEVQSRERSRIFPRETGARAVIMAPIGLGDQVIGLIYVIMIHEPREWTEAEAGTLRQVAGFVARASVEAENQARQREHLERIERLDRQKSDFLATVSHELRTPLTSISGYLELLQDEDAGELTPMQHGMLEVIDRNTFRLRNLIENLMMLNRIEGGVTTVNFAEVSIPALIARVGEELILLAQSSAVELEIDAGPPGAVVLGDSAALDRAMVNILSNAIKFSHPGGVVNIRGTLDVGAGRVLVTCQDHGVGIPARDQADLFTRFFRASNATEQAIPGTGLGLSIARQIIEENHHGELRLVSVENQGTTLIMDLPLYEASQVQAPVGNDSCPDDVFGIRA